MDSKAYKIYTSEGSIYIARFDPLREERGILWGRLKITGYSEAAERDIFMSGVGAEPEVDGKLIIETKPWAVEVVEGEEVPLYEYETISRVDDITHLVESMTNDQEETEQEVESAG